MFPPGARDRGLQQHHDQQDQQQQRRHRNNVAGRRFHGFRVREGGAGRGGEGIS